MEIALESLANLLKRSVNPFGWWLVTMAAEVKMWHRSGRRIDIESESRLGAFDTTKGSGKGSMWSRSKTMPQSLPQLCYIL